MKKIFILVSLLGFGSILWRFEPNPPRKEQANWKNDHEIIVDKLSAASDRNIKLILDNIEYENETSSDAPEKLLTDTFPIWNQLKSQINKHEARAKIANNLRLKPGMLDLASSVLVNKELARKSFGENQALSRILSIRVLEEELKSGNDQPIIDAITKLNKKYEVEYPDMGELQDVEDLLTALFKYSDYPGSLEDLISGIQISTNLKPTFIIANLRAVGSEGTQYTRAMKILSQHFSS